MGGRAALRRPGPERRHPHPEPVRLQRGGREGAGTAAPWSPASPPGCCAAMCTPTRGRGESTTDLVFGGHNMIAENGTLLAERGSPAG